MKSDHFFRLLRAVVLFTAAATRVVVDAAKEEFGVGPDIPLFSFCRNFSTTWIHPVDGDVTEIQYYCIADPTNASRERCYHAFVPDCASTNATAAAVPMVMVFHGKGGCPAEDAVFTRWGRLAKEECFVVVYPWVSDGWNQLSGDLQYDGMLATGYRMAQMLSYPTYFL